MTGFWRLWIVIMTVAAALVTGFGLRPGMTGQWWPVAGLWAAAVWASYGLSVWSAVALMLLGVMMDYMTEGPIGAWPLALLSAYGVGLVAWDRAPPIAGFIAEGITVIGGMIAAGLALWIAGSISGQAGFWRDGFFYDFLLTALLYPAARFAFVVADPKEQRR
jgi:hypothetical protein